MGIQILGVRITQGMTDVIDVLSILDFKISGQKLKKNT